jgi:ABC-type sugar transport system substrate-binding protein
MLPIPENKKKLVAVVSLAVILFSGGLILLRGRSGNIALDRGRFESLGRVMAEQTAKSLGDNGDIVLFVPVSSRVDLSAVAAEVAAFREALEHDGGIRIVGEEKIAVSTPDVDRLLSPELYFQLAAKYPSAAAIISFGGVAYFPVDDLNRFSADKPPVFAVSMGMPISKGLIDAGLVRLAIVPRGVLPETATGKSENLPAAFSAHYRVVTTGIPR